MWEKRTERHGAVCSYQILFSAWRETLYQKIATVHHALDGKEILSHTVTDCVQTELSLDLRTVNQPTHRILSV